MTCTSKPCFLFATGFLCAACPGGSSLDHKPHLRGCSPAASTRSRAVCTCFFAPWGFTKCVRVKLCLLRLWVSLWYFAGLHDVSLALCVALGIHCDTLGLHFDTHGVQLGVVWGLWGPLGASFRQPGAPFGFPWGPCWCLVGTLGCGPGFLGHFRSKGLKKPLKMHAEMGTFSMVCRVCVESGKQHLDCACAVGLRFRPLVFNL